MRISEGMSFDALVLKMAELIKIKKDIQEQLAEIIERGEKYDNHKPLLYIKNNDGVSDDDGEDYLDGGYLYEAGQRQVLTVTRMVYNDAIEAIEKDIYSLSIKLTEMLNNK